MGKIRVAIVDDEEGSRKKIEELIERSGAGKYCESEGYGSGKEIRESGKEYDIVMMDIELGEEIGIEVAKEIKEKNGETLIYFVTSYYRYISQAFEAMPFQYILKPIDEEEFDKELRKGIDKIRRIKNKLEVTWNNEKAYVKISEIEYIESYKRKLLVKKSDGEEIKASGNIRDIAEKLGGYGFVRSHNGYVINIEKVESVANYRAKMASGEELPISKKYNRSVKNAFAEKISGVTI